MILALLLILMALEGPRFWSIFVGVYGGMVYGDAIRRMVDRIWKKLNDKLDEWAEG